MPAQTPPGTIFIVDDDEGLVRLMAKSLRREGYGAATASSGKEALLWLQVNKPGLMLLDLKLTDVSGAELVDQLRSAGCLAPFIIITGQGDERVAVDMMKRGALDYIVKDGQFLELVPVVVQRALAQVQRERELEEAQQERKRLEREVLEISEREQRRIGHDLHDGLGQTLAGVDVLMEVLKKRLVESAPAEAESLAAISTYVKDAIQQTRMLAHGLSPVEVERNGLMFALKVLAEHACRLFKVDCTFECATPVEVSDHAKATHLYRIAQEAMHNAVRHGRARRIQITLTQSSSQATLRVLSSGGEAPASGGMKGSGMGQYTMKYRAEMIGGTVEVLPVRQGTEVICTFPPG